MSIAPHQTDIVELTRVDLTAFDLRIGHNIVRLDLLALADLLALLTRYPAGTAGQTVHGNGAYKRNPSHPAACVLVAHVGSYDGGHVPGGASTVGGEPWQAPATEHIPNPSLLTLAVSTHADTYVANLSIRAALALVAEATSGMSDAV